MDFDFPTKALQKWQMTTRKQDKARKKRTERANTKDVRGYVFARERNICRCCRSRNAESMHEIVSRGRRGKRSRKNSIAVCGVLVGAVPSCHTYLQQSQIAVNALELVAEDTLRFTPKTKQAAEWMRVQVGHTLVSPVMVATEEEWS